MNYTMQNIVYEWTFCAQQSYQHPSTEVTLDMLVTAEDGQTQLVPAFWAGENRWQVRFASPVTGTFHCRTLCNRRRMPDCTGRNHR